MLQIKALQETDPQWEQVCAYAAACSWKAGPFLAKDMTDHLFTGWERVFAAISMRKLRVTVLWPVRIVSLMSLILPISAICLWTKNTAADA